MLSVCSAEAYLKSGVSENHPFRRGPVSLGKNSGRSGKTLTPKLWTLDAYLVQTDLTRSNDHVT